MHGDSHIGGVEIVCEWRRDGNLRIAEYFVAMECRVTAGKRKRETGGVSASGGP